MILSKNSAPIIILPESPTPRELFAAEELKKYIFLMLSANANITTDNYSEDSFAFILGSPDRCKASAKLISEEDFYKEVVEK